MLKKLMMIVAIGAVATSAFASHGVQVNSLTSRVKEVVALKDGSTVYVFENGKMGMANPYDRATRMNPGEVMETKDGKTLVMNGDEVARVDVLLRFGHNK